MRTRILLLLAISALAVGCGDKKIDADKVEKLISNGAANPEVIDSIDCPDDVKAEKGKTFNCKLKAKDGSEETVSVEQLDDDGTVRVSGNRQTKLPDDTSRITIKADNAEALVRGNVPRGGEVTATRCPDGVKLEAKSTFECSVTYKDGSKATVTIEQVDELGNIRIQDIERAP